MLLHLFQMHVDIVVGDAELSLVVTLVGLSSGKVIGEWVLDTRSKRTAGIFGGTTSRQLEAIAQKIVEDIALGENRATLMGE